jgi:hypothetical protein
MSGIPQVLDAGERRECLLLGVDRKETADGQFDAIMPETDVGRLRASAAQQGAKSGAIWEPPQFQRLS